MVSRELADFCLLLEMQHRGEYTLADRQQLAVIQARAETRANLRDIDRRAGP